MAHRALLLVAIIFGCIAVAKGWTLHAADSTVFATAARRFLDGEPLYRLDDRLQFKYAPATALILAPLGVLPMRVACALWGLLSALAFYVAGRRWLTLLPDSDAYAVIAATIVCATSLFLEAHFGQINLIMLWLLTEAVYRDSGVPLAWAAMIKPTALFVLLAVPVPISAVLTILCAFGVYSHEASEWWRLLHVTTPEWITGHNSQGFIALLYTLFGSATPTSMSQSGPITVLAIAACTVAVWRLRHDRARMAAACILCVAALSPLAWRANYVLAWPAVLALRPRWWFVTIAWLVQVACTSQPALMARPFAWLFLAVLLAMDNERG